MSGPKVPFQETWQRWSTRATSQLAPIKEKLRNTATQVAGIAETMQELEDDSQQLALKVTWVTQIILDRIAPDGPGDERAKEVVSALAAKVSEISAFLRSGTKKGDITGKRARKISKYHKTLDALRLQCVEIHTDVSNDMAGRSLGQQGPFLIDIPPTPEAFYSRDEVVESIVQLLLQDKLCRVPILGPGGIGKTSVAAAAMNDEQVKERYREHIFFLSCEGIDSEEGLVNALAVFFRVQRDSNTRTALIAHLSSLGRALLTLDNFETTAQSDRQHIRELLGRIGRVPSFSLIITMRGTQPAQGLTWDDVPPLQNSHFSVATGYGDCGPLLKTSIATLRGSRSTGGSDSLSNSEDTDSVYRIGDEERDIAECLKTLGNVLIKQFRYEEAAAMVTEARAVFEAIPYRLGVAQCMRSHGEILRVQSRYDEVAAPFTEARAAFEVIPNRLGAAQCVRDLGDLLRLQSRYDEAAALLTEARAAFEAIPNRLGAAQCAHLLAHILNMQSQHEEAAVLATEARAAFEAIPNRLGAAECVRDLGDILRMQSRHDEAASLLTEARAAFAALPHRLGAAHCTQLLGESMRMQSQYEEATSLLTEARAVFQAVPQHFSAAVCILGLGNILVDQSQCTEALSMLREAEKIFEDSGTKWELADCKQSLAYLFVKQGRISMARHMLDEAREIFEAKYWGSFQGGRVHCGTVGVRQRRRDGE
ncbi:TPR-like protein [Dacryopinax primogenitus]|uniref:TPR-like protein n=1 Tax=Dacryopinax primogenitus (strain DJM 731) TaxID=1858805 RepID=M5FXP1_DACPD|nr:TPR-like protein [Dacryopinax primogenitus]EJU02796.1 TPR-like protein [Dacryopinax primogenitus]